MTAHIHIHSLPHLPAINFLFRFPNLCVFWNPLVCAAPSVIMSGHTDSLVLLAPVLWWPALADLSQHPLDPVRSFCAAVTGAEAPHQHTDSTEAALSSYGLSRLGRSAFLGARWVDGVGSAVEVVNPFSGAPLVLEVRRCPPGDGAALFDLALADRIRIAPLCVTDVIKVQEKQQQQQQLSHPKSLVDECMDLLFARHRAELLSGATAALRRRRLHTALVSGDAGSGKRALLERVASGLPPVLPAGGNGRGPVLAVEQRCLNMRELLAMDEREAVAAITAVLRPIPHCCSSSGTGTPVAALILVRLYHADLLWQQSTGNAMTDVVSCQLCASLDELADSGGGGGGPTAFVVWATAVQPSLVAPPLRQRLAAQHVRLATPTVAERAACLALQLKATVPPAVAVAVGPDAALLEALVDATAHLSAWRLANYSAGEGRRGPLKAGGTPPLTPPLPLPLALAPLQHQAYAHLFGVASRLSALEELVVWPLTHLRLLRAYSVPCAKGVLVCGPSGSGKTALLSALAARLSGSRGVQVVMVDGLSLIEKEVGRSEKNIARLFETARAQAPTALFLDNLDALAPPRGRASGETTTATDRTLSTLLTEMDGVGGDPSRPVVVVASAPGFDCLDAAVRRPGRLDVHLTLTPPPAAVRAAAVRQRLSAFLARLIAVHGFNDGDQGSDRLRQLEQECLAPCLDELVAAAGSSAETVAVVREVILSTLASLAVSAAGADGTRDDWGCFKSRIAEALRSAARNA